MWEGAVGKACFAWMRHARTGLDYRIILILPSDDEGEVRAYGGKACLGEARAKESPMVR